MKDEINRIYLGLPENLKITVFWVARPNRTNQPSNLNSSSDLIVEYRNGLVLGFDWIKMDSKHIMRILQEQFFRSKAIFENCSKHQKLNVIKNKVYRIYGRIYEEGEFKDIPFEKIWDADNDYKLPWENFEQFKGFLDFNKYWDVVFKKRIVEEVEIINDELWYEPKPIEKWHLN